MPQERPAPQERSAPQLKEESPPHQNPPHPAARPEHEGEENHDK
jgi:hypothetical protein